MNETIANHPHLADAMGNALAAYDRGTFEHSSRVGTLAIRTGEAVGLESTALAGLGWAGMLHDVGKLAVSEEILQKTGKLTPAEWSEVKAHPVVGCQLILAISPRLEPIASAIRSHHERWDGTGYPDGLQGEAIPILGRIIALADVYDALTEDRPYRQSAFSATEARKMIEQSSGSHFDPMLVPLFLGIVCHKSSKKRHGIPLSYPRRKARNGSSAPTKEQITRRSRQRI